MNTAYIRRSLFAHWLIFFMVAAGTSALMSRHALAQVAAPAAPAAKEAEAPAKSDATAKSDSPAAPTAESAKEDAKAAKDTQATAAADANTTNGSAPAASASAGASKAEAPDASTQIALPPLPSATDTTGTVGAPKSTDGTTTTPEAPAGSSSQTLLLAVVLVSLFVLPILAGNYLAKIWKMPDYGWKISLVLFSLVGSLLVCTAAYQHWWGSGFKFGPDLAGGITLIYELAETPAASPTDGKQTGPGTDKAVQSGGREFKLGELIGALKKRIDPTATKEITIRAYGPAVEIIIPQVGQDEMEFVKQKITALGQLEFRITADSTKQRDLPIIALAKSLPPNQKDVMNGEEKVAAWLPYDLNEFGRVEQSDGRHVVKRMAGDTPEILVLMDPWNVTGEYLSSVTKGIDENGGPAVHFKFKGEGARRFGKLTGQNKPNPATPDVFRYLGIVLDNRLVSAPSIRSQITDSGQISGQSMTEKEVDLTVEVLNAGSLPAKLNKAPISEEVISPTLGGITVQKGKQAIIASLIGVVIFMIVYYRFAGVIACVALTLNLFLVLALMVMIRAAFTLPGLAGLALTVGMSVDTNVLIYERIREELKSGAALRMAIRNGYGRAMSAIIDTHLTTIISGIVLFYVGTDQVKGFAVTLVLGILCNLFTAFFCTRVFFDIAERRGWVKQLTMMHVFSEPNYDFLSIRWYALGASWLLIAIGMVAVYFRGSQLFDIDFTGGSSVAFTLNEADKMQLADVRKILLQTDLADKNLLIVERGKSHTGYQIDTSEQSVEAVKAVLSKEFGDKLKKYSLEFTDVKPFSEGGVTGTEAKLLINQGPAYAEESGVSHDSLRDQLTAALAQQGLKGIQPTLTNPNYQPGSGARYKEWTVRLTGVDEGTTRALLERLRSDMKATPLFPLASKIGGRVSGNMQFRALEAIAVSLVAMIIYLWLRFQKPAYGIAAGVALLHDVFVTVGLIALSAYIVNALPGVASLLRIDAFQINLTIVAALLTIIGYSVNDTVVTFDRLREIKGKTPQLTAKMVNDSVNQTLSRTILTVLTVFIVVVILYFFGGEGLHSFAFAFLVGIVVGTYSSVYIASPVLLWLSGVSAAPEPQEPRMQTSARGMQPAR
jgi:SecD/SecF fusion protein